MKIVDNVVIKHSTKVRVTRSNARIVLTSWYIHIDMKILKSHRKHDNFCVGRFGMELNELFFILEKSQSGNDLTIYKILIHSRDTRMFIYVQNYRVVFVQLNHRKGKINFS